MQTKHKTSVWRSAVFQTRVSAHTNSREVQTLVALIWHYSSSGTDLALQQQWDHAANAHLSNIVITPHSSRKVSWTCDQCPDGHLHSWSAAVKHRSDGTGCPQCIGRKVCRHNSLATKAPLIAAQWDYEANDGTPDTVVAYSSQKIGWCCDVVATSGAQHRIIGSAWALAAHSVQSSRSGQGAQPLRIIHCWLNGTTDAMQLMAIPLAALLWEVTSRSPGCATNAQQDSSTAGLLHLIAELVAISEAVQSVLGRWHADATPCRHSTLA